MLEKIKYHRKRQKLTQIQLSQALGVSNTLVGNWEGRRTSISAEIVPKLCQVLEITPNELFGFNEK